MRKRAGITIVSLLVICTFVVAGMACAQPSDITGHWAQEQIGKWVREGLAGGYPDGTFKPNQEVSRAEFVALTNRAFGIETKGFDAVFSDVSAEQWYYDDIAAATAAGYTGGYPDGTFKPKQSISRQEAASILVRLLNLEPTTQGLENFQDAAQIPEWSRSSIGALVNNGLMGGYPDNTFKPARSITRAEAVVVLDRAREFAPGVIEGTSLEGTVTLDGKPAGGATVRVFKAGSYEVLKETETDSKGHYEFRLPAGDYDITAVTDTKVAYRDSIELTQENDTTANLDLQPAAVISGVLEDENGRKVKEAKLLFTTNPTFVLFTDSYGEFNGAVLPDRTYTVRAYEPGEDDEEPVIVSEAVEIGSAGTRHVDTLTAPFSVGTAGGGGGGGVGGGGGDDSPIVLSQIEDKIYNDSRGYIIKDFGTFGPTSGKATFETKLTIDPGDSGTLTLQNIDADNIEVLSGGTSSVHTKNLTAKKLIAKAAAGVKIEAGPGTEITRTEAEGETIFAVSDGSSDSFGTIEVKREAEGKAIQFEGDVSGSSVTIQANNAVLRAASGAKTGKIIVDTPGTFAFEGGGTFGEIEITENSSLQGEKPTLRITTTNLVTLSGQVQNVELEVGEGVKVEISNDVPEEAKSQLIDTILNNAKMAYDTVDNKEQIILNDRDIVESALYKVNAVLALLDDSHSEYNNYLSNQGILKGIVQDLDSVGSVNAQLAIEYSTGDNAGSVTKSLTLPTAVTGYSDVNIVWESSVPGVVTDTGVVTRPGVGESDAIVVLTVTISKGKVVATKTFSITVKALKGAPYVPSEPTLPALLDAIKAGFENLSEDDWDNLKEYRDNFLDSSNDDILESLRQAGLVNAFESIFNSDITDEEARVALSVIRELSYIGKDNITDIDKISSEIDTIKEAYNEQIAKLVDKGVNQERIYRYAICVYNGVLDEGITTDDSDYEKQLYDIALDVLRDGEHSELRDVAELMFDNTKKYYGEIISDVSFNDLNGAILLIVKNELKSVAEEKDIVKVQEMFDLFDFMLETSKVFLPSN